MVIDPFDSDADASDFNEPGAVRTSNTNALGTDASSSAKSPINPLFVDGSSKHLGPLSALESSRFSYKTLRYPNDVDKGAYNYYIKFNVLMNIRSKYSEKLSFGDSNEKMADAQNQFLSKRVETFNDIGAPLVNAVKGAFGKSTDAPAASGESQSAPKTNISALFKRQVVRTEQSISLYMPNELNWSFTQKWDEPSITEAFGKAGLALTTTSMAGAGTASLPTLDIEDIGKKIATSPVVGEAVGGALGSDKLGAAITGVAINPSVEVLYGSPELRTFQFEFVFAPRNKAEADTAITIIQMFKFHSAPEFYGEADLGRYFIPPSEFDIEFVGRNGELWQLGKMLPQCVLTNVTVNYGASGKFSTFEDGTPTNIQLQLNFKETAYITKERVEEGY